MLKNLKLRSKLLVCFMFAGVLPFLANGGFSIYKTRQDLTHQAFDRLESVKEIKKAWIEDLFVNWRRDITYLAEMSGILLRTAQGKMNMIHHIRKQQAETYFKDHFEYTAGLSESHVISDALARFSEAFRLDGNKTRGSTYSYIESRFDKSLREICKTGGFDNLYLITKDGDVIYSLDKGSAEGKNVSEEPLKNASLSRCFYQSLTGIYIHDFEAQPDQGGRHAAFIGAPIRKHDEVIGVIAVELHHDFLNRIMQQREGLDRTGETFLVGRIKDEIAYRNDRVIRNGRIGETRGGQDIEEALSGKSGQMIRKGTDSFLVMSTYGPLDIPGLNWAIITTIGVEEVINPMIEDGEADLLTRYIRNFQYSDLLLIHADGEVLYSVKRGREYRENLLDGQFQDSGLGQLFRDIKKSESIQMTDIRTHAPDDDHPAAFIGAPVTAGSRAARLFVALRIDILQINRIMTRRDGMGKTGQTYLVGKDRLMRSDAFLDSSNYSVYGSFENPDKGSVDTESVREAFNGNSGAKQIENYAGESVISSYAPLTFEDITWAMIAEINRSEALETLKSLQFMMIMVAAGCLLLIILAAVWLARSISRPIRKISQGLDSATAQLVSTSDEMSSASQSLSENASEQAASIEETSVSLDEIKEMSVRTSELTKGAEELMFENIEKSSQSLKSLVELTREMTEIESDSDRISRIIALIDGIAFQTNLLALNAAIEAARAGDAGSGFAVVAEEVRNLSLRTAEAADDTQSLLGSITIRIGQASQSVRDINMHFEGIIESATVIGDKTSSITSASSEQAKRIEQIVSATHEIDRITQKIAAASEESASVSEQMYAQSEQFRSFVRELVIMVDGR